MSRFVEGVKTNELRISGSSSKEVYSTKRRKIGNHSHGKILTEHIASQKKKSGKKGSIARNYPKVWVSWAQSLRAQIHGEVTRETLQQERCARGVAWNLAKIFTSSRMQTKATFHYPVEARAMPAPTSQLPQERARYNPKVCTSWA